MKFNIETNKQCRVSSEINAIINKMYAIEDNLEFIFDKLHEQYPNDELSKKYSTSQIMLNIEQITVDLCMALDEFYLENLKEKEFITHIEVVTETVAEGNDKDFVNITNGYTREELDTYKVGGTLSDYTKLGDSEYYFKFM